MIFLLCVVFFVIGFIAGRAPLLREIDTMTDVIAKMLKTEMETNPGWAEGLPLKAEVAWATYYGK